MSKFGSGWGWLSGIVIGAVYIWSGHCAFAQITPDATLPNNSIITGSGNTINITGGTQAGGNLFHSFQQFSVPTGSEAFFNNGVDIANIISRVTGGLGSKIDGFIRANGTANLFLINPNGIVFGPNARLNIGGSFIGSTASSLKFADGTQFSATNPGATPLLTISVPLGLQFGSNPKEIQVNGPGHEFSYEKDIIEYSNGSKNKEAAPLLNSNVPGLEVGKTLALVGGNVSISGGVLKSPAGRIEIGSVGSNGVVSLVPIEQGWKLGYEAGTSFADIELREKSFIGATGDRGGAIAVAGRNINFTSESIVRSDTLGDKNGQQISILGDAIVVDRSNIGANTISSGNGGQIKLEANNITFKNNGGGGTQATASGSAGDFTVIAKNSFVVSNQSGLGSKTFGAGNTGMINVEANSFVISNQSGLGSETFGAGNGGVINIKANSFVVSNQSGLGSTTSNIGNGGVINVEANSFVLSDKSGLNSTTGQDSTGNGGEIKIKANSFVVSNQSALESKTSGTGNGGVINVEANSVRLEEKSGIAATSFSKGSVGEINIKAGDLVVNREAGIGNDPKLEGNGGKINIIANSFQLENAAVTSTTGKDSTANGGDININVAGSFVLNNPNINVKSSGTGNAGTIQITANNLQIEDGNIKTDTDNGKSGNIFIKAEDSFRVNRAGITANSFGTGDAGTINITAKNVQISDGGIDSSASNSGKSGNISINATDSFSLSYGGINANSSGTGDAGTISFKVGGSFVLNKPDIKLNSSGTGNAGTITIDANNVQIEGGNINSDTNNSGKSGNISIKATDSFRVVSAGISANSFGTGDAGTISITANNMQISDAGIDSIASASGKSGNISINATDSFELRNGSIKANSAGTGNAGTITIEAKNVQISDGGINTSASNSGKSGDISINATNSFGLIGVSRSSGIEANSSGTGDAGTISITAKNVQIESPVQRVGINSIASNSGKSGNIRINTKDSFRLSDGGITTESSGTGNAGTISITAKNAQIERAGVSSNTQNTGKAGEINFKVIDSFDLKSASINTNTTGVADGGKIYISAKKLQMQDNSSIHSDAKDGGTGRGGDIELQIGNLLLLRRQSSISTTATGSGNGGNISINVPNGFIVTVPNENSDITANASTGGGGKIKITSLSNFGIQKRSREDFISLLETTDSNQLKPEKSQTNDITAFSQTSPTLEGQVIINTPDIDPSKGFVELPTVLTDMSSVINTSCTAIASAEGSKFIVTGRGGLPPSPNEPLSTDVVWLDTRLSAITTQQQAKQEPADLPQSKPEAIKIVPATGWVFNGKGQVTLISDASKAHAMPTPAASCPKR
ncbi:hypothetical protein NIES4073_70890 [Kalymmatonema gypsitolerans NIES-4073]|nr:hypothetical protein NIES4073_70890 [Scytonema sp. NIES-4073]